MSRNLNWRRRKSQIVEQRAKILANLARNNEKEFRSTSEFLKTVEYTQWLFEKKLKRFSMHLTVRWIVTNSFEKERESKISVGNCRSSSQHCWQWHCNNTKILVSSLVSTRGHRYTGVCRSISRCKASSFNFKLFPSWSVPVTFDSTLKLAKFSNFYACNLFVISIFQYLIKKIASTPWINKIENKSLSFYMDHIIHISHSMNNLDLACVKLRNM